MPSDRHNFRLLLPRNVHTQEHFPDTFGGLVPVHERHVAVHENEGVLVVISIVDSFLYDPNGLLAVECEFGQFFLILETQYHQEPFNDIAVEFFIVDDQYFANELSFAGGLFLKQWFYLPCVRKLGCFYLIHLHKIRVETINLRNLH